jgi:uncharacterized damage-inducible protein DinB
MGSFIRTPTLVNGRIEELGAYDRDMGPDVRLLFDYSYWATREILRTARELTTEQFVADTGRPYQSLRGTLVNSLDVERSWRRRLRGEPRDRWDIDLPGEDFPTLASLESAWHEDEEEMRAWLERLGDDALNGIVDLGPKDRFPLVTFLLHILTYSAQRRRDAAIHLERAGVAPPEIDFLYYADLDAGRGA